MASHYHDQTPIRVAKRGFIMYRRTAHPDSVFYIRVQHGGKRFLKSTETSHKELAKARAKSIVEAILNEKWEELSSVKSRRSSEEVKADENSAKISEIGAHYLDGEQHVRTVVAKKNFACLKRIATLASKGKPVADLPVSVLTEALAKAFQAKVQGRDSVSYTATLDANVYANSCLRQARSLFSKTAMKKYAKLHLPDLSGFMHAPYLKEPSQKYSDHPIPLETIEKINAALPSLKEFDKRLWAIHLMIRLMGMRDSEIIRAQKSWLIKKQVSVAPDPEKPKAPKIVSRLFLQIIAREGDGQQGPKRQDGEIPVPAALEEYFASHDEPTLIPGKTATERKNLVERGHSQWLRKFLPDRTKTNHELRKHAGSVVATKTNSFEKAAQFLRIDIATAKAHYLALLTPMTALSVDDLKM